jgi:tetratricopeptide (TPR) repeat protein
MTTVRRNVRAGRFRHAALLRAQRRYTEAIPEYEKVLASNPNWAYALFALGQCGLFTGSIKQTIPLTERAILLSPRDPQLGVWYQQIATPEFETNLPPAARVQLRYQFPTRLAIVNVLI